MANKSLTTSKSRAVPWLHPHQFKKGESGNPAGREKGHKYSLRAILNNALQAKGFKFAMNRMKDLGIDVMDGTHGDLISAILLYKAESGDMDAIKEIIRLTVKPLGPPIPGMGDGDEELPDNAIKVTVNIVKNTQNVQNNFNREIEE